MLKKANIAVLVSGGGTNLEALLKAQEAGDYTYRVYFNEKFAYQHQVTLK